MKTFDEALPVIIPEIQSMFQTKPELPANIKKLIINRDVNGRIRLLAERSLPDNVKDELVGLGERIAALLGDRVAAVERIIYEPSLDTLIKDVPCIKLKGFPDSIAVIVADRLLAETDWGTIKPAKLDTRRIVFYSIKGGVGRSTALAAAAWTLAEEGKKVLILDMDLESPGISSSLLDPERTPEYGIVDWLVEDLLDNGDEIFASIAALSDLSQTGEIFVVPSYGKNPGEYISKLGRVWAPKYTPPNNRELWQSRLDRLIRKLETRYRPDVVLIDSRAGIDEISSACITSLGAASVLLFAIDSDQTWDGYRILFKHWLRTGAAEAIRERLQIIGALIPDHEGSQKYADGLCERSWDLFTDSLYDSMSPGDDHPDRFNFDKDDIDAPHYPRLVRWNRGFEARSNLYQPLGQQAIQEQLGFIFGGLLDYMRGIISDE